MEKHGPNYLFYGVISLIGGITTYAALQSAPTPGVPVAIAVGVIVCMGAYIVFKQDSNIDTTLTMLTGVIAGYAYANLARNAALWIVNGVPALTMSILLFALCKRFRFQFHLKLTNVAVGLAATLVSLISGCLTATITGYIWAGVMLIWILLPVVNRFGRRLADKADS